MNKYVIFSISVILIITLFISFNIDEDSDIEIIGISEDFQKTDSGYIFYIIDGHGNRIKSYYTEKTDDLLHNFKGNYSVDGNIFFISKID